MLESVRTLDFDSQVTFNSLVDYTSLGDAVHMLLELGVDTDKLKGAVYGWALQEAGLD